MSRITLITQGEQNQYELRLGIIAFSYVPNSRSLL